MGKVYRGAAGEAIPNQGQKIITVKTQEWQSRRSRWQICPVTRPLMSVARCTAAGNQVYFSDANAHIKNVRTGEITKLRKEGAVFVLDLWVKAPSVPTTRTTRPRRDRGGDVRMSGGKDRSGDVRMTPTFTRPGR